MRKPALNLRILFAISFLGVASAQQEKIPGFDPANLDRSVSPCENFYRFSCGGWTDNNPIPSDQARWGRFDDLRERNLLALREILEEAQAASSPDPVQRKIGVYYGACMDEAGIEQRGVAPLVEQLAPGGWMVLPVGRAVQELMVVERREDGSVHRRRLGGVRFVPMTGEAQQ